MNRFQTVQREEKPVCKASFGHGLLSQICAQAIACMFTIDENVDRVHKHCTICGIQRAKVSSLVGFVSKTKMRCRRPQACKFLFRFERIRVRLRLLVAAERYFSFIRTHVGPPSGFAM